MRLQQSEDTTRHDAEMLHQNFGLTSCHSQTSRDSYNQQGYWQQAVVFPPSSRPTGFHLLRRELSVMLQLTHCCSSAVRAVLPAHTCKATCVVNSRNGRRLLFLQSPKTFSRITPPKGTCPSTGGRPKRGRVCNKCGRVTTGPEREVPPSERCSSGSGERLDTKPPWEVYVMLSVGPPTLSFLIACFVWDHRTTLRSADPSIEVLCRLSGSACGASFVVISREAAPVSVRRAARTKIGVNTHSTAQQSGDGHPWLKDGAASERDVQRETPRGGDGDRAHVEEMGRRPPHPSCCCCGCTRR